MRDRMERFVLLPFTAGCISESSIAVGLQEAKRSKMDSGSTPTRTREGEEEYEDDEESLSGENLKSPSSLSALPRFHKLFKNFKNFSHSFVYKDELEETEMGMEIGLPTDVKHVTHIGLDGCASSILSKRWDNLSVPEMSNLPSFPLTPVELATATHANKPTVRSLQGKPHFQSCQTTRILPLASSPLCNTHKLEYCTRQHRAPTLYEPSNKTTDAPLRALQRPFIQPIKESESSG